MYDFHSMFAQYLMEQKANSANTRESYLRDVQYFLEFLGRLDITPLEADERDIQAFVQHLADLKRSTTTISRNLASIRCFYKFLIMQGLVDHNPAKAVKLEKAEKKLPQVLLGKRLSCCLPSRISQSRRAAGTRPCWSCCMRQASGPRSLSI